MHPWIIHVCSGGTCSTFISVIHWGHRLGMLSTWPSHFPPNPSMPHSPRPESSDSPPETYHLHDSPVPHYFFSCSDDELSFICFIFFLASSHGQVIAVHFSVSTPSISNESFLIQGLNQHPRTSFLPWPLHCLRGCNFTIWTSEGGHLVCDQCFPLFLHRNATWESWCITHHDETFTLHLQS